ncbi:alpha/beta fold hydrolase [Paenibacillus roseipurpureus]|uniref:Alpha/beta hydrolase n=1 Tax=Paenibacillus roseopurpureus TaxID=2918901 RepID=A0AA96LLR3_9BACL|nr:alpha/beta hydrolase [Paenibacillus sp. MBLB1832]WNR42114.1 alpha/beta hydrolase [Paenibacillus sp. MBLB1832]
MGYYVQVEEGVKLFVEDVNPKGKRTILFIHGWPLSHSQFEYQFNVLPAQGYRCIGLDWRGFGQSDKPYDGYNYDRLADDLYSVIQTLKLDGITLAGHSTGGAIAIRYMSKYHGHGVEKLVLIDAAAPIGFTPETARKFLYENANDRPAMLQNVTDQFFFQYITPRFSDWFVQMGLEAASWSTAAVIRMLRDENVSADLSRIEAPTLIVHGIHDHVIPYQQALEMNKQIPHSRLVPFHYSGHGGFWEERDRFNQILMHFVG